MCMFSPETSQWESSIHCVELLGCKDNNNNQRHHQQIAQTLVGRWGGKGFEPNQTRDGALCAQNKLLKVSELVRESTKLSNECMNEISPSHTHTLPFYLYFSISIPLFSYSLSFLSHWERARADKQEKQLQVLWEGEMKEEMKQTPVYIMGIKGI